MLYWNGHRVMGVLAMSRAIGDHSLRPYIIPEPEVRLVCGRVDVMDGHDRLCPWQRNGRGGRPSEERGSTGACWQLRGGPEWGAAAHHRVPALAARLNILLDHHNVQYSVLLFIQYSVFRIYQF